ncbi:Mucin-associated surface protein (MASP) [Trypanosoma cruzi]|uniref:Mucin-associated surface protein (MASP), putative n=2 Tax=Trypanosoma cruzi TaxID=5693 RepID=Q4DYW9_TRYCC|nr:mucin-associated surface protein (MASP), putative [Trypanosoma cruzi]EAN97736.1 mucin-associated surface protein (MASP), putative [Trypanosoma cruzi]PWV17774.1 Mucin-associated surface protein (MASP) [Trypanosoma cruzi]|eukprot:XP_819587.1 mucin-associated surface protein (MASP) [Trypanosoma cruzi strain CL Brener]
MAMMMTGRVLLVCALCVLCCGVGGRCEAGVGVGAQQDGGTSPPESKGLETSSQDSQDLKDKAPVVKGEVPPASPGINAEEEDDDDDDDGEGDGDGQENGGVEVEEKPIGRQGGQGGTAALGSDSRETNLSGSEQENHQAIVSAEGISHSDSRESKAILTQPEFEEKNDSDKNTTAVENPLTTVNGENTLPAGVAGGNPPPPKDGVGSREQDGEDTTSEGQKNVPLPESAATPQSHQDKGSEGTGEDTKATTVTANTTDTTNTQTSDGITAVSHTTSPLLLLLLVACTAAAAVVVAA